MPPHFHAYYNNNEAIFTFDGELFRGDLPKKQLKLVSAWSIIHKKELEKNWKLCKKCEKLSYIQPLS